mmetsp:Transcript_22339/g.29370  ORF Transcript_22339/g.29370 Transcript_22339/m.29370 type:complete len:151 (+) Transcript_22339:94-546(+)
MKAANNKKPSLSYNLLEQFGRGNSQRSVESDGNNKNRNLREKIMPIPSDSPRTPRRHIENLVDFARKGLNDEVRSNGALPDAWSKTQEEMAKQVVKDDKKWKEFQTAMKSRHGSTGLSQSDSIRMLMTEQRIRDIGHDSFDSMQHSFSSI